MRTWQTHWQMLAMHRYRNPIDVQPINTYLAISGFRCKAILPISINLVYVPGRLPASAAATAQLKSSGSGQHRCRQVAAVPDPLARGRTPPCSREAQKAASLGSRRHPHSLSAALLLPCPSRRRHAAAPHVPLRSPSRRTPAAQPAPRSPPRPSCEADRPARSVQAGATPGGAARGRHVSMDRLPGTCMRWQPAATRALRPAATSARRGACAPALAA